MDPFLRSAGPRPGDFYISTGLKRSNDATVALVGIFAGFLPAWQAYDSDVARDLAERG